MKKLRHIVEYIGLVLCLFLAKHLPLAFAELLANGVADAFFFLAIKRRRIACDNVRRSGIATDKTEIERIVRASFRHLTILVVEALKAPDFFGNVDWRDHVTFDIAPESQALIDDPAQGVILASAHLGNWELGTFLLSRMKPVLAVVRKMNNPYADRLVREKTHRREFDTTPKSGGSGMRLVRILRKGGMLGLLIDQHATTKPMMVDFFGVPAATHTSPALLHMVTKSPICMAFGIRHGPMKYTISVSSPLKHERTGDKEHDVRTILEAMNADLERMISRYPEQYLWAHRRWKKAPEGALGV